MWIWKPLQEIWWNKKAAWWTAVQNLLLWKRLFTASLSTACFGQVAVSKLHLTALLSVFRAHWWWFLSDYFLPTLSSNVCYCCHCIHRPSAATGTYAELCQTRSAGLVAEFYVKRPWRMLSLQRLCNPRRWSGSEIWLEKKRAWCFRSCI